MEKSEILVHKEGTIGDIAVDGLFDGILAGLVMGLLMIGIGLLEGDPPGIVLTWFSPSNGVLSGLVTHMAVSSVYGVIFSLIFQVGARRWLPRIPIALSLASGLLYGLILWALAQFIMSTEAGVYLSDIPRISLFFGHLTYRWERSSGETHKESQIIMRR